MELWVVVPFSRSANCKWVEDCIARQRYTPAGVVIVENGPAVGSWHSANEIVLQSEHHQSVAKNVGMQFAKTNGATAVAIFDDDDYYGPGYLEEAKWYLDQGYSVLGKSAHFFQLSNGELYYDAGEGECTDISVAPGGTLVTLLWDGMPNFFRQHHGEDNAWCVEASKQGHRPHGTSRFNFMRIRHKHGHTYPLSDAQTLHIGQAYSKISKVDNLNEVDTPDTGKYTELELVELDPYAYGLFDTFCGK